LGTPIGEPEPLPDNEYFAAEENPIARRAIVGHIKAE